MKGWQLKISQHKRPTAASMASHEECPLRLATSVGRCNTLLESFGRCFEIEHLGLGRSFNSRARALSLAREVRALGEVLAKQAVGILVRSPLPWILRVEEVDLDTGCQREALMVRHLLAAITG